jgi:predicted nucleotidyltransferase
VAKLLNEGRAEDVQRFLENSTHQGVGPFRSEGAALGFLRDRLVYSLRPDAIWLFGSRAHGNARPDSDFDLLVVLPDGRPEDAYTYETAARPVVACGLAYDIVPCRWSELLEGLSRPGTLGHDAINQGRLIYKRRNFELPPGCEQG